VKSGEIRLEKPEGGPAVLTVQGEHDLHTAPEMRRRIDELIAAGQPIVVDLSPATFVDSSILGVLLDGRRRAAESEIGFTVAQAEGSVAVTRVLQVTGLRSELPVHESLELALSEAAKGVSV
jgi:anti-sigma B factor antagonist